MARDPVHRQHHQNEMTFGLVYAFSENFVLPISHDEVVHGKGSLLGKMPGDRWQQFANLRAYLGFMFGHPGKKLLFMGCEFAQVREWNHDQSLDWHLLDDPQHAGVQRLVRDLNRLYRATPALYQLDFVPAGFEWMDHQDAAHSVLAFIRRGLDARQFHSGGLQLHPHRADGLPRRRAPARRVPRAAQHRLGPLRRQQCRHAAGRRHGRTRGLARPAAVPSAEPAAAGHRGVRMDRMKPVLLPGRPWPLGATWDGYGVNFAVFSAHAQAMALCLFDEAGTIETSRLMLPAHTDDVWHGYLIGAAPGLIYGLRAHGLWRPDRGHRFNPAQAAARPVCPRGGR